MSEIINEKENNTELNSEEESLPTKLKHEDTKDNHTPDNEESKTKRILGEIVETFEVAVCAVIAVVLLFAVGVRLCFVNGTSMNKTLDHNDWVIVSNIGYEPTRGDIIVFHMTSDKYPTLNEPMVKRVIAVGGEWIDIDFDTWTVRIADNPEMIGAVALDEPYVYLDNSRDLLKSSYDFPLEIPEGYIFVMGDNRNNSLDSRNSDKIGLIDTRRIIGKVLFRAYPFKPIEN